MRGGGRGGGRGRGRPCSGIDLRRGWCGAGGGAIADADAGTGVEGKLGGG